jgi:hypothetical protein
VRWTFRTGRSSYTAPHHAELLTRDYPAFLGMQFVILKVRLGSENTCFVSQGQCCGWPGTENHRSGGATL